MKSTIPLGVKRAGAKYFETLGAAIQSEWRAKNFRYAEFPEIADRLLRENPPHVQYTDIIRWILRTDSAPEQDLGSDFGQPPITLFRAPQFHIEALFWLDGTTLIHQHSFSGAFHVLAGSSIQSRYDFHKRETISPRLLLGEVQLRDSEYLSEGDTQQILAGSQFIHSLFHLDRPSVTIVVRTNHEPESGPQYEYRPPFLAVDPFSISPLITRRLQVLDALQEISKSTYKKQILELLSEVDFETAYLVLNHCYRYLNENEFEKAIGTARKRHGSLVDLIVPVIEQTARQNHLISMRANVQNPDHRFFLALLLNLKDQSSILSFIRKRFGDHPMARIEKWIQELSHKKRSAESQNALGIQWTEVSDQMIRLMIRKKTFLAILKEFEKSYSVKEVQAEKPVLYELYSAFRNSIFRPLFQENQEFSMKGQKNENR